MTELSKLQSKLAEIDRAIAASVDYIELDRYSDGRNSSSVVVFSPRLSLMKSDCLKYIAQARVNQLLKQRQQ
jgi:hypothetical protein